MTPLRSKCERCEHVLESRAMDIPDSRSSEIYLSTRASEATGLVRLTDVRHNSEHPLLDPDLYEGCKHRRSKLH